MQSLLNFRFGSAICAGGHTGCVQKELLSEFHRRGAKPRKINIAAKTCYVRVQESKNDKKIKMERFCNPLKRMELVITPRRGNTSSVPQCARVPEAGIWNKIITPICTSASPRTSLRHASQILVRRPCPRVPRSERLNALEFRQDIRAHLEINILRCGPMDRCVDEPAGRRSSPFRFIQLTARETRKKEHP